MAKTSKHLILHMTYHMHMTYFTFNMHNVPFEELEVHESYKSWSLRSGAECAGAGCPGTEGQGAGGGGAGDPKARGLGAGDQKYLSNGHIGRQGLEG